MLGGNLGSLLYGDVSVMATDNYQEASNSVGIHLNQGDVIDLRCSSDNNTFDFMISFMGFLLYPAD